MALVLTGRLTKFLAILLLAAAFALAFLAMKDDALTFDELAHIPAGYSYLTQQDYRINPEHPPLAKDLAALPLLFQDLNFPEQSQNWLQDAGAPPWWVQFDLGTEFLYRSGNDPLEIIVWSRIPMIFLLLALGWLVFSWTRTLAGNGAALLALFLFSFSPTLLAHGRLVTTDVAAAFGAVLALHFWVRFLKEPTKKHVLYAGLAFGIAMLLKFSLILLVPVFALLTLLYPFLAGFSWPRLGSYLLKAFLAGLVGLILVIWPTYAWHTANYPMERQVRDTIADLSPSQILPHEALVIEMAKQPLLRPMAQYLRGVGMALQRSAFGNTTYFQGEVSAEAFPLYFPALYLFKVPLASHLLLLLGSLGILLVLLRKRAVPFLKEHFDIAGIILFLLVYALSAVLGNLNIGVRHLLPLFPFLFLLAAWGWNQLLGSKRHFSEPSAVSVKNRPGLKAALSILLALLLLWYAATSLLAFPHYISYYNQLAGGTKEGYRVAVDSNYDWGQDFYRLAEYVEEHDIKKLRLDYFGGEYPPYWLGNRYEKLDPFNPPDSGWVAVSLNQLMGGIAEGAKGFDQPTGYYDWLKDREPAARIGTSIFLYSLD